MMHVCGARYTELPYSILKNMNIIGLSCCGI
uniref:Uncharacterized protein n=1 Tax=Anguilla anguilla TaxID=7936 RepID=A0A0E9PEG9_ANGAN